MVRRPRSSVGVWVQMADADKLLALWRVWFCLPSRVSSLKSSLSAANWTNGPGVMFDVMTSLHPVK